MLPPSQQMHNRGNGKGGGILAMGFIPEDLGVTKKIIESHYIVVISYLDTKIREALEKEFIYGPFDVQSSHEFETRDYKGIKFTCETPYRCWVLLQT